MNSLSRIKLRITGIMKKMSSLIRKHLYIALGVVGFSAILCISYYYYRNSQKAKACKHCKSDKCSNKACKKLSRQSTADSNSKLDPNQLLDDSPDDPVEIYRSVEVSRGLDGILNKLCLIKIFNKRCSIRGIRKLNHEFKEKRRKKLKYDINTDSV